MAEVIIFVGLQGAGKTTYFAEHFAASHQHVSRDIAGTAERERILIQECLRSQRSFVLDNTNATQRVREPLIRQAKAAGFQVLCYFFDVPVRTAIGRNNHRNDKKPVPVPAILRTAKLLEPPSLEEGFDEIRTVPAIVTKS
jgi:predicted kinase